MKKKIILLLAALVLFTSSCSKDNESQQQRSNTADAQSEYIGQQETERRQICFGFIKNEMITSEGGVRTNYLDKEHNADYATGAEVLSESMGLLMLYAAETSDEALFKSSLNFVEQNMDTGSIISYRYSSKSGAYHVNAFVDDLRIIRALIMADSVFEGDYLEIAMKFADRLYDTNVKGNYVYDMYDELYRVNNDFITLCYIDLYTMQLLGEHDARWLEIFNVMLDIAKEGYISDEFPMYSDSYSYASEEYDKGDINMVQAALTALNLAAVGECPQRTLSYLKDGIKNGELYGSYSYNGKKTSDTESTAIYAICALIAREAGDEEMYGMCVGKINSFQVTDEASEVYGAFADPVSLDLYSFDNLMALLAYR